jgi:DNA invertase Pin-like site-specific DNA recombinase
MKAAIYRRVSTVGQVEGFSLDDQADKLTRLAEGKGFEWEDFCDPGLSGEGLEDRPALTDLLARLDEFSAVLVVDDSRLARDELPAAIIRRHLRSAGVRLVTLAGEVDLRDPASRFTSGVLGLASQLEQDLRRVKMMAGLRRAAQDGYWTGGEPPYGFQVVADGRHRRLAVDETEAEVLRTAVSLILDEGLSCWGATKRLNALGIRPRRAGRWTSANLLRHLRSPTLAGEWSYARRRGGRATSEAIEVAIPPILAADRFQALQASLNATARGPKPAHRPYPLSGRITGLCGELYTGYFRNDRRLRVYRCKAKRPGEGRCPCPYFRADDLETVVWGAVVDLLSEPERLLAMAEEYLGLRGAQLVVEREQLDELDRRIRALDEAATMRPAELLKAGVGAGRVAAIVAEIEGELETLRAHREMLVRWASESEAESERMRGLWKLADVAHRRLRDMGPDDQTAVLRLLEVRVTVLKTGTRNTPPQVRIEGKVADRLLVDRVESGHLSDPAPGPWLPVSGAVPRGCGSST